MQMAEAPAITFGRTRDIPIVTSREAIPTLTTVGQIVINKVLPRTEGIAQEVKLPRSSYVMPTPDRGNIGISTPADRLDGPVIVNYSTILGKGKDAHGARVAIRIENGYASATVSDMQPNHPVVDYKPPQDELVWLTGALTSGEILPPQTYVKLSHKVEEVDAPPIGI